MASIKRGILGGFSKKIGNIVGSSWKGIAVMKSLPLSVANPRTTGQVLQRSKMTNVVAFAKPLLSLLIKPFWDRFAVQASGFNDFVRTNISLFASEMPTSPGNLVISQGKMAATPCDDMSLNVGLTVITLTWFPSLIDNYQAASDLAKVVFVNYTQKTVEVTSATVLRSAGTISFTLAIPAEVSDEIYGYLAFSRADGSIVSNTSFYNISAS
jgi:hypothetical protein